MVFKTAGIARLDAQGQVASELEVIPFALATTGMGANRRCSITGPEPLQRYCLGWLLKVSVRQHPAEQVRDAICVPQGTLGNHL